MKEKIKNSFSHLEVKFWKFVKHRGELKNIRIKKKLYKNVVLSNEQKKLINDNFVKLYGKKYSDKWHRLYQSYTGQFDKDYFPEILFSTKLSFKLNPYSIAKQLCDKSLLELLFSNIKGLKLPKTYVINCSNIFYDSDRNIISREKVEANLQNIGKCIIKPIRESSSGKNVCLCDFKNGVDVLTNESLENILKKYGKNYIIQQIIKNCKELSNLHPQSLNTIRLITYTIDGKMFHCPIALRIGRNGKIVDNAHAGGIAVGMNEDGELKKYAFTEFGEKFSSHPDTNIVFEGYKIPKIKEMIEVAYKCHSKLPHMQMISWDLTIDNDYNVTLIELNLTGQSIWFPQYCNGESLFGENTKYMYRLIKKGCGKVEK